MGCGCGKTNTPKYDYVFTGPDGRTKTYTSEIQAQAAQVRAGGGTYQAVKR